jgi:hypothetical protein
MRRVRGAHILQMGVRMAGRLRRLPVAGCFTLLACLAGCRQAAPDGDAPFAGRWVLSSGGQPFLALTLDQRNGQYSGSLTTPEHWTTADGIVFTNVGPGNVTRPITSTSTRDAGLHIVVENPADRTDVLEFDLARVDPTHASLTLTGAPAPFMPWRLARSTREDPASARGLWDPAMLYRG